MKESILYFNGRFGFIKAAVADFCDKFISDRVPSGDDKRRYWSARLASDEQKRVVNEDVCAGSRSSLRVEGVEEIVRVKVVTVGGGGEQVRLKDVEFEVRSRCFCVEAIVGSAKCGVDGETDEDEEEEEVESAVLERDNVAESFVSVFITAAIVCIAESVSLSTFCWDIALFCNHVFTKGLFGLTGGGVDADFNGLSWLVILS
jgi:hypothetical protein